MGYSIRSYINNTGMGYSVVPAILKIFIVYSAGFV